MIDKQSSPLSNILIIGPAWIGDMVMAQTLFKLIKSINKNAVIDVLAPAWTLPLIERMPEINKSIAFPFKHGELNLLKRYRFAKQLRNVGYTQAIVLPGSFKSALTPLWAKISHRTGWLGEYRFGLLNDFRYLDKNRYPLMVQRYAALAFDKHGPVLTDIEPYYPQLTINDNERDRLLEKFNINKDQPLLALCPGAEFGPSKRWPENYYSDIANRMQQHGWQVVIFGSKKESDLAATIKDQSAGICIDLTGKTSLTEAIDIMSLAGAVISNDSGLMHIAAALGRPLVVIYGSSSPNFTPPLSKSVAIMKLDLDCSPCFKRSCPLTHLNCMKQLTPDLVFSKLVSMVTV